MAKQYRNTNSFKREREQKKWKQNKGNKKFRKKGNQK